MVFLTASGTSGTLTNFFANLSALASEYQVQGNGVLIGIAALMLGSKFLIGDDETKARARKQVPYILIGAAIVLSAFNIAASAGTYLTF